MVRNLQVAAMAASAAMGIIGVWFIHTGHHCGCSVTQGKTDMDTKGGFRGSRWN